MQSKTLLTLLIMILSMQSWGQDTPTFKNDDGVALRGYDVVSYHTTNQARRGSTDHMTAHEGAQYYFSSAENKSAFEKAPQNYLPKFGGFCAFGMAMQGALVPTDPETFKLHNGDLYLFFNDYYQGKPFNTSVPWNQNESQLISQADENWKKQ